MNILDNLTKTPNLKKCFGRGGEWEGWGGGGGKRLKKKSMSEFFRGVGGGGGGRGAKFFFDLTKWQRIQI